MKNIKSFILFFITSIAVYGCEDNFDPKLYGTLNPENYPTTESEYEDYTMTCYIPFTTTWQYQIANDPGQHSFYIPEGGILRVFEAPSDNMAAWNLGWGSWMKLSQADYRDCVYAERSWVGEHNINHIPKLAQITRFTEIIATLEKADDQIFKTVSKKRLLGEAHLCRGLMLYYLMHIYGPLPAIVDKDDINNENALTNLVRPSLDDMTTWIYNDFQYAMENLPDAVKEHGRYTSDYAKFCMMKHCLNEGAHMKGYYEKAMQMCRELSKDNRYSLFTKGDNPYVDMFKAANDFNCEIIMAVSCDPSANGDVSNGNFFPLSMLATPNDASKVDDKGNPTPFNYQGGGWMQAYNVSPKLYDSYEAKDKRRTVILDEYWVNNQGIVTEKVTKEDLNKRWSGYIIYKYPIETNTTFQGNDFPLARWADVLLMMAEVEVRQSNAAPSPQAVEAVNQVRRRSGLDDLSVQQTATKEAFLDVILDERSKEFLYEGHRKIDLIRFNKYAQACFKAKGTLPTHQYIPLPNYLVEQAKSYGKQLSQIYNRPQWEDDIALAN